MKSIEKKVKEYLALPWENEYRIVKIPREDGGGFSVCIPVLGARRCRGDGETIEEAVKNLRSVLKEMIEEYLRKGRALPLPEADPGTENSGALVIRTTSSLHTELKRKAKREGVSLNYLVGMLLERGLAGGAIESALKREPPRNCG